METIANEGKIENILTDAPLKPKKKKYLDKEERINRILEHKSTFRGKIIDVHCCQLKVLRLRFLNKKCL